MENIKFFIGKIFIFSWKNIYYSGKITGKLSGKITGKFSIYYH